MFDPVGVIATQLTFVVRTNAWRLLGVEEVAELLETLRHDRLVAECGITLVTLRTVLRNLLREGVPIRDLARILECIADHPGRKAGELTEAVRRELGDVICHTWANSEKQVVAVRVKSWRPELHEKLAAELDRMSAAGLQPTVVVEGESRPILPRVGNVVVLSSAEIADGYCVQPWSEL